MQPNKIRLAGIEYDSIVDGPGLRMTIFVQGCPHRCKGCHNPDTHNFSGGVEEDLHSVLNLMKDRCNSIDGITLSGGEPFSQAGQCAVLALAAHQLGLNVWCYTGWMYEELLEFSWAHELLKQVDVLVDGRFEVGLRTLDLPFRGSSNQRIIDVEKSLECGCAIRYNYEEGYR